jgi:hypothetical protein
VPVGCFEGGGECLVPPVIVTGPVSQSATNGNAVRFSVTASGTEPLTYQWYFEAVDGGGAGGNAAVPGGPIPGGAGPELRPTSMSHRRNFSVLQQLRQAPADSERGFASTIARGGQNGGVGTSWSFDQLLAGSNVVISMTPSRTRAVGSIIL